jgi:hypothetical protein
MEAESKGGCVVKLIGFKDSRDAPIRLLDSSDAQLRARNTHNLVA